MREQGRVSPIYFCGFEPGYESASYPGLYDPRVSGDTGPLINALEAYRGDFAADGELNHVPTVYSDRSGCRSAVADLRGATSADTAAQELRRRLQERSVELLAAQLASLPRPHLARVLDLSRRTYSPHPEHSLVDRMMVTAIGAHELSMTA
jgi:hypothetical protein